MKCSMHKVKAGLNRATAALAAAPLLLALQASAAAPTYFWDTNGTDDGPGNPPTADWYVSTKCWTLDPNGDAPPFAYDQRANLVFAATGGAYWDETDDYTVTVHGIAQVSDLVFQDGNCTMTTVAPYYLDKDTPYISVLNYGQTATMNSIIASAPGTSNGITKFAWGTLVLSYTNTYRGPTTVEGGILRLGAPQVLPSTSMLVLAGGDTRTDGYTYGYSSDATFATSGFSQTLGPLLLTGPYDDQVHTLDLGSAPSTLAFADSHLQDWSSIPLNIVNYIPGTTFLRFGTSSAGLTATQLNLIQFADFLDVPGKIDSQGFVSPAAPLLLSVVMPDAADAVITWSAINGRRYIVDYKNNLTDPTWTSAADVVVAAGSTASLTNSVGTNTQRFYRVELLPVQPPS